MDKIVSRFTVFFEEPFWVGVFECESRKKYEVCKITFGAEPTDAEIYEFLQKRWNGIRTVSCPRTASPAEKRKNPKRIQREISAVLHQKPAGTMAQNALKRSYEQNKLQKRAGVAERKRAEADYRFERRMLKKKEKRRGH